MRSENSLVTNNFGWNALPAVTAAAAATPAVAARSYSSVKGVLTHRLFEPDAAINALELRFSGTTNNDAVVFDLLAARGAGDHFTRIATLSLTVGQQRRSGATDLFVDTITLSNVKWPVDKIIALSGADDYIATVWMDRLGYHSFCLVPTTVAGTVISEWSGC